MQLATLVTKFDELLTAKPPALNLSAEQKAKIGEQLKGLDEAEELKDEDAKKRLDAILEVVKDDKTKLEAAGYHWPGQGGEIPSGEAPKNPFKDDATAKHLKSLQGQLTKGNT
jgi:hypothetical protein